VQCKYCRRHVHAPRAEAETVLGAHQVGDELLAVEIEERVEGPHERILVRRADGGDHCPSSHVQLSAHGRR
jgi:hypothetical protein